MQYEGVLPTHASRLCAVCVPVDCTRVEVPMEEGWGVAVDRSRWMEAWGGLHADPILYSVRRGRVRTKTVKRASRVVIEKYYPRLTLDL